MSYDVKRYLRSSLITFISAFAIATVSMIDGITLENVGDGALVSLIFTGSRAGVKAVFEIIAQEI